MDTIVGDFYVLNNEINKSSEINYNFNNSPYLVYEVIRCESGKMFFIEDHLERMQNSLISLGFKGFYDKILLKSAIYRLLVVNKLRDGNIKIMCKISNITLEHAVFYVPHFYPTPLSYKEGVKLITYQIERNNPNIKQISVNQQIKSEISNIKEFSKAYEVLLVNYQGEITEGSASNFFLVKNNTIYSAPENYILKGITRKYVLHLCKRFSIKNETRHLILKDIQMYDAAFICGTSPKILPAASVNEVRYDPEYPLIQKLIASYNKLLISHP